MGCFCCVQEQKLGTLGWKYKKMLYVSTVHIHWYSSLRTSICNNCLQMLVHNLGKFDRNRLPLMYNTVLNVLVVCKNVNKKSIMKKILTAAYIIKILFLFLSRPAWKCLRLYMQCWYSFLLAPLICHIHGAWHSQIHARPLPPTP